METAEKSNPQPQVVKQAIDGIKQEIPSVKNALDQAGATIEKQGKEIASQETTIKAYGKRWVGDKTFFYGRLLIGVWIGAFLLGNILNSFSGGFLKIVGRILLNVVPNPLIWKKVY